MNLKIGSALKALAILLGMFLGLNEELVAQFAGGAFIVGSIGWDLYETFRLQKQGVVSTSPAANVAQSMSPAKLAIAEEDKLE